jgi:hypothetical protein
MRKVAIFAAYCPLGNRCSYGNSHLGKFEDEEAARRKIYTHLTESSRHYCKPEEAEELTRNATVGSWEQEVEAPPEPTGPPKGKGTTSGKGDRSSHEVGKGKGKHATGKYRQGPYSAEGIDYNHLANVIAENMAARQSEMLMAQAEAEEQLAVAQPAAPQMTDLLQNWTRAVNALARGHATLTTCARLCRSAAATFDEEAHNVAKEMEFLASLHVHPDALALPQ